MSVVLAIIINMRDERRKRKRHYLVLIESPQQSMGGVQAAGY